MTYMAQRLDPFLKLSLAQFLSCLRMGLFGALFSAQFTPLLGASDSPLDSMVQAEKAFARKAAESTIREAFLGYMAADALLLRPFPVHAQALYRSRPASAARLHWYPRLAWISRAGDLGFTAGPSEFRATPEAKEIHYGHFVSLWGRSADGSWKNELDLGISHEAPPSKIPEVKLGKEKVAKTQTLDTPTLNKMKEELMQLEFAQASEAWTLEKLNGRLAPGAWFFRDGGLPNQDPSKLLDFSRSGKFHFAPVAARLAHSGDLACTWGFASFVPESGSQERYSFVHGWIREGTTWKLFLDVALKLP